MFNLRSSCCFKAWEGFFAKHAAGQLIRVGCNPKAARMWGRIREKSEPVFLTSFIPLFPPLSLYLSPSPFHCLPRSRSAELLATALGRGERGEEKKKERRKVGQGDLFFFPTVHEGRGWRCYRQLDEEQGLMGRQGLVARRSHSELGQQQRLCLVNGLSYRGEKLQMNHRLYAPSRALRSLLAPQTHTSKNTHSRI